ncbi:TPA_exp: Uncharacterized protein A8136_2213 [Trichophyton benhamiae CBS 112371]|nr:TPA_exp: Uncharacterized protein A8136_2213 [Trichophyton benhamiae CBS 112371]
MVRLPLPHRRSGNRSPKIGAASSQDDLSASSTGTSETKYPLILKTQVISGRNLAAKDRNGMSDPYLVVTLGHARESTPTISKTLNPEWNVCFDLPIVGVPLLECVCWDKDRFGKDYMGEFDIALEDIFSNGQVQQEVRMSIL